MNRRLVVAAALVVLAGMAAVGYAVTRPDPHTEALADGCARNRQAEFAREAPGWVYVGDRSSPATGPSPPAQWLEGTANGFNGQTLAAHPSGGDDPTTHDSFDFNVNVLPDPAYQGLVGGDPASRSGNFEGEGEETQRVHIERETNAYPTWAWAEAGDRVKVLGSWVWDCGHWDPGGERTELHPYRATWVVRSSPTRSPSGEAEGDLYVSTDATPAGVIAECGHRTKGDRAAFKACLTTQPNWLDVSGDYDLTLRAPPRPAGARRLVARVVDRGSTVALVRPAIERTAARLRFHLSTAPGERLVLAEQVFLGWTPAPKLIHLRIRFERLLVRRAMDPGCPTDTPQCGSPQSTLSGQIATPPGEWRIYVDAGGQWRLWPELLRAGDGSSFRPREAADVWVRRGQPWRLLVWTHECDFGVATFSDPSQAMAPCPKSGEFGNFTGDDVPGLVVDRYRGANAVGTHRRNGRLAPPSTCPRTNRDGCFQVAYTVSVAR